MGSKNISGIKDKKRRQRNEATKCNMSSSIGSQSRKGNTVKDITEIIGEV